MNKSIIKFLIFVAVVGTIAYVINAKFIQMAYVNGDSMLPTYKNDDIIFINKNYKSINREDVIIGKKNNITFIKRVVAIENDKIIIKDGKLYINDKPYDRYENIDYAGIALEEITLKKGEYFVLGDNINHSMDSRYNEIGIIKKYHIIGVVK